MFDIGFSELLIIAVITLIVMGPERLPETVRSISLWLGRIKQMFTSAKQELEKEVGMDEIRRQLQNEKVLRDLNTTKEQFESSVSETTDKVKTTLIETESELASDPSQKPSQEKQDD
ncbi:MAG: Sec-independent protein translocase protein TatB [Porticoccaceae bacterium]|nr:Sec-independent protein translocase protein TatB [Porticoccaceae bacterium]